MIGGGQGFNIPAAFTEYISTLKKIIQFKMIKTAYLIFRPLEPLSMESISMSLNLFNGVILCHWPKEASPRGGASGRTWSEDFVDHIVLAQIATNFLRARFTFCVFIL